MPDLNTKRKKSRKGLYITAGAVVGLLAVVGIANSGDEHAPSAAPVVDPTPASTLR